MEGFAEDGVRGLVAGAGEAAKAVSKSLVEFQVGLHGFGFGLLRPLTALRIFVSGFCYHLANIMVSSQWIRQVLQNKRVVAKIADINKLRCFHLRGSSLF